MSTHGGSLLSAYLPPPPPLPWSRLAKSGLFLQGTLSLYWSEVEWTFWEMSNSLPSPTPLEDRGCHGRPSRGLDKWATGELSGSQLWLPFQSQEEIFKQGCSNPTSKDSHLIDLGISIV